MNKQVSDVHLEDISRSCCSGWRSLPSRLEMRKIVAEDIDRLLGLSEEEKRLAFFRQWKREKGSEATYKKLIDALEEMNCREDAENVCRILQSSGPHKQETQSESISDTDRKMLVKINKDKIKGSFAALMRKVTVKLEKKDIDMKSFRSFVRNLFPPGDVILNSHTITEIFDALSRHGLWDYSSCCTHLEVIMDDFGGDDFSMKEWISNYKSELAGFKATTKIVDYIEMCSEKEMADSEQSLRQDMARYDKCYCRKITFKLKARVTEKSLNYIDAFWQSIADYFLLPSLPALLDSIHSGCVEVTWLVSTPSALQIQANIQDSAPFLQKHGVMRVVMDGEVVVYEEGIIERFFSACKRGDVDETIALLTAGGVHVDTPHMLEMLTPLNIAAQLGNSDMVERLLQYGASIDLGDGDGYTALINASLNGSFSTVLVLLEHGASPNIMANDGWTALSSACYKGHLEVARALLQHGALPDLHKNMCWTPLMEAIDLKPENLPMVKLLLDAGASPNETLEDGTSPLIIACEQGSMAVIGLLLEHGANIHQQWNGLTAMHTACQEGHLNVIKELQSRGASLEFFCEGGISPLISACARDNVEIVEYLLEQKPSLLNIQSQKGWSPLMFACNKGNSAIVACLLSHGANTELCNHQSTSPLMAATFHGNLKIVMLLLEANAPVDQKMKSSGWTALFIAAEKGYLEIAKVLMNHGADISLKALDSNLTPYDVASMHGQTLICEEMELHGYQAPTSMSTEEHTKQESGIIQRQSFLDMENIKAFRTIVRGEGRRHNISKHGPQTHSSPGTLDFNTYTPSSPS